jgi:hypothetical protein
LNSVEIAAMPKLPPAVRILPMSRKLPDFESWDALAVQDEFFLSRLPASGGQFLYQSAALKAEPETVVLFQYAGVIVALAELMETVKFVKPLVLAGMAFRGVYQLDPLSIRTFQPLDAAHLQQFWPKLPGLGQAKHKLDPAAYPKFVKSLRKVRRPRSS